MITGAKKESDLSNALTKIYPVLVEFKKTHVATLPGTNITATSGNSAPQPGTPAAAAAAYIQQGGAAGADNSNTTGGNNDLYPTAIGQV